MTRCVVYCWSDKQLFVRGVVNAGFEPVFASCLQEAGSLMFRDSEAIGCLMAGTYGEASETVREYRIAEIRNPVLFFVAEDRQASPFHKTHVAGIVRTLGMGADDVQPGSFHVDELTERLKAIARRSRRDEVIIELPGGCTFNEARGILAGPLGQVSLTRFEASVLIYLAHRAHRVVPKPVLLAALYNGVEPAQQKIIDVYVCKIRKKIAAVTGGLDCIETVWGQGFRFIPAGFRPSPYNFQQRAPVVAAE